MRSFFALNSWYSASFSACVSASAGGAKSVAPPSTPAAAMPNSWSASLRDTSGVLAGASALADAANEPTNANLSGAIPKLALACRCSYTQGATLALAVQLCEPVESHD